MLSLGGRKEKKRDLFICSGGRTEPVSARSHSSRKMSAIIFYRLTIPTRKRRPRFVISNSPLSSSFFADLHRSPCMSFSTFPVHSSCLPPYLFSPCSREGRRELAGPSCVIDRVVIFQLWYLSSTVVLSLDMRWLGVWAL